MIPVVGPIATIITTLEEEEEDSLIIRAAAFFTPEGEKKTKMLFPLPDRPLKRAR